jgi:hypothetical protein
MVETVAEHPLLQETAVRRGLPEPPASLLDELREVARATDSVPARSQLLLEQLRKMMGQPRLTACLHGIQILALAGEPAGARLLAALLDANTPGALLLPRLQRFSSCRRLILRLRREERVAVHLRDWRTRFETAARFDLEGAEDDGDGAPPAPGFEPPFPLLRLTLQRLVEGCCRQRNPAPEEGERLAELIRLEADAYQERVSTLVGAIDPFKVAAVARVLPLLSRADAEIRDVRQLIAWIEEGDYAAAFQRRIPRLHEILDERERERFLTTIADAPDLEPLAALLTGLQDNPLPVRQLAAVAARMMALAHQLVRAGVRRRELDLVAALRIAQLHHRDDRFGLPLGGDLASAVGSVLIAPQSGPGAGSWSLAGLEVVRDELVLRAPGLGLSDRIWRHDLPTGEDADPTLAELAAAAEQEAAASGAETEDLTVSAIKQLVLNSLNSTSVILGFLRNRKITGIPGLVAAVARRSRTVRVLEVIASDRALYTGHANRDVPLACLQSPCNVPVKALRKFVNVKYVSKTELRRLSQDRAGIRPEVAAEIQDYLRSLT